MKNKFKPMLVAALICIPYFALSQVKDATQTDGVWGGGYRSDAGGWTGTIIASFQRIGDLAKLDLELKSWGEENRSGRCGYIISLNDDTVDASYTTETALSNASCPSQIDFTVSRKEPELISLALSTEAAALFEVEAIELRADLRPPLEADLRTAVPNLDILGVAPGMSAAEAGELLISQGFSLVDETTADFGYFSREKLTYGRNPSANGNPSDLVDIRMSASADWLDEDPVVMLVGRYAMYFTEDSMSETKLQDALLAKYGPSSYPATDGRYWSRNGQADPESTLSMRGVTVPFINDTVGVRAISDSRISIEGGPRLNVSISEPNYVEQNAEESATIVMRMAIEDPDPIWKDFWLTWSHREYGEMQEIMDRESSGTAPEL